MRHVHEHDDRRGVAVRPVDVQLLDGGGSVGHALRRAQSLARELARPGQARVDLVAVGRVYRLVVGIVEFLLVVIEKDARTFRSRGFLRGRSRDGCGAAHACLR
jgi:hypothetical protein